MFETFGQSQPIGRDEMNAAPSGKRSRIAVIMSVLPSQTSLHEGAYTVMNVIGRGGFGITYRARDEANGRVVAIKECFPAGCERQNGRVVAREFWAQTHFEAFKARLRVQAQQLERVTHPHLARVWNCFDANDTVYLVMEWVPGPTLQDVIEREAVAPAQAEAWIEKIAGALDALHEGGLLHLDLKPENIVLRVNLPQNEDERRQFKDTKRQFEDAEQQFEDEKRQFENAAEENSDEGSVFEDEMQRSDGEPVLLDFDLVQPLGGADGTTRPLSLAMQCGTPGYAPLEQYAHSAPLSPASDVYALGATFYHLLSGRAPVAAVERAAQETGPPALAQLAPQWNEALARALELRPDARLTSARQFLEVLRAPVANDDEDSDAAPLAPRLMTHGTGTYRVVLTQRTPVFPSRCVCCHDKADTRWHLNSPSGKWELPLCGACEKHQLAARASGFVTLWGSVASLVLALLVVGLSLLASSLWPLLLGPFCIVLNFAALSYGALKSTRAEEALKNSCCDALEPATYVFNGRVHIWRFKNAHFAADFRKKNASFVV